MARKARLTVFSRFLILMLFVGPIAFLGASYYNGEDGLQTIKDLFNSEKTEQVTSTTRTNRDAPAESTVDALEVKKLKEEIAYKDKRIEELYQEVEILKRKIADLEQ
ncbi:MAG: hypothetical protein AAGJ18_25310 [Bacteroidota bacterium]